MAKYLPYDVLRKQMEQEREMRERELAKAEGREYQEPIKATYTLPNPDNLVAYMYEVAGTLD